MNTLVVVSPHGSRQALPYHNFVTLKRLVARARELGYQYHLEAAP
jgi:hypothetical protein